MEETKWWSKLLATSGVISVILLLVSAHGLQIRAFAVDVLAGYRHARAS